MARTSMNLQDGFLNQARKDAAEVRLVLVDGSQLVGVVRGFDNFTIILNSQGTQHLIYKHAIAQVVLRGAPRRGEGGENRDSRKRKDESINKIDTSAVEAPSQ